MKDQLIKIINEINEENSFFGIIPLYPVFTKAKDFLHISLIEFHSIIKELEKSNFIYLEPINDINRLTLEEKKTAIYDEIRGYLFYIGLWN